MQALYSCRKHLVTISIKSPCYLKIQVTKPWTCRNVCYSGSIASALMTAYHFYCQWRNNPWFYLNWRKFLFCSNRWPYPFLDLASPCAPAWYGLHSCTFLMLASFIKPVHNTFGHFQAPGCQLNASTVFCGLYSYIPVKTTYFIMVTTQLSRICLPSGPIFSSFCPQHGDEWTTNKETASNLYIYKTTATLLSLSLCKCPSVGWQEIVDRKL